MLLVHFYSDQGQISFLRISSLMSSTKRRAHLVGGYFYIRGDLMTLFGVI